MKTSFKNLMKLTLQMTALCLLLGLTSCKTVKFKNGEVPNEYLNEAKKLEGDYKGFFFFLSGTLTVHFEGNKPSLSWKGDTNQDFTDNGCETTFGNLLEAELKSGKIQSVLFRINPQGCPIQGKDLQLKVITSSENHITFEASVMSHLEPRRRCEMVVIPGGGTRQECTTDWIPVYLKGRFSK